jgi:YtfJ family uncharacterized protein
MIKIFLGLSLMFGSVMAIELGEVPSNVVIDGENGGRADGKVWNSSMLKDKVHVVFYVDPDKKDENNAFSAALKARHFDRKNYGSVAIVNLAATWMPNALIESKLKSKQKEFPDTTYVKDKKKVLVNTWKLADDNSDILIFDKKGKLIYKKFGKVSDSEIKSVISLIEKHL